jgi:inorganic pyrophosphatase
MYKNIIPKDETNEINVIIEISKDSDPVKYEIDKDTRSLIVDRFIPVSMMYPCNYGFIPNTLGGDGDPIDALVISVYPIIPGALIKCKVIGVIMMEDESGVDEKIIAVPTNKIDINSIDINDVQDLPKSLIQKISHFFERYKDLEPKKRVKISGIEGRDKAIQIIENTIKNFN